jgi:hypothetical protein
MRKKMVIARILALMMTMTCVFGIGVINVKAADPFISPTTINNGGVGQDYSATLTWNNNNRWPSQFLGQVVVVWSVVEGNLPAGLSLHGKDDKTATISGTPTTAGSYSFKVNANSSLSHFSDDSFSSYTITISAEPPHVGPPSSTKTGTLCSHDYQWETSVEPTASTDGEAVEKCSRCGHINRRQTISSFSTYMQSCIDKIKKAKAGDTVIISDKEWNSYPKSLFEAIAARPDLTVKIQFPNEKHLMYELTINPNQAVDTSCDFYGYAKMISMGATALNK